jgi:hypothetical protein
MAFGRARMIESIDQLTGTQDCTEAVLVQTRPTWALPVLVAVVALVVAAAAADVPFVVTLVAILVVVTGFTAFTGYWVIGRTPANVVVARSSKIWPRAVAVHKTLTHPVLAEITSGLLQTKATLDGEQYYCGRLVDRRLRAAVAPT